MKHLPFTLMAALLVLALPSGSAQAADDQCREIYVATQRLQRSGQLRAARRAAVACGQDQCLPTVRASCIEWLANIERALPTLVLDVRDARGEPLAGVRVEANGELLSNGWDGRALELDPGEYTLRFSAGGRVVERVTVVREGEKYHHVEVRFGPPEQAEPPLSAPLRAAAAERAAPAGSAPVPLASYVLGGAGLAGLTAFAVLGVNGYVAERRLRESCGRTCPREDIDSVRLSYLLADVGLAVGVISAAVAGGLWLRAPSSEEPSRQGLALGVSGVRWRGQF